MRSHDKIDRIRISPKKFIANPVLLRLSFRAVRGRGGSASEPRQALIGATVVCPGLPRIPWRHFSVIGLSRML